MNDKDYEKLKTKIRKYIDKWEVMLDDYYRLSGWNHNGVPTREKLDSLNLSDVADSLENAGAYRE